MDALRRAVVEMLIADGDDAIAGVAMDCSFELGDVSLYKYPDLLVGIPAVYAKQFGEDANANESGDQALLREAVARAAENQFTSYEGEPYNPEIKFKIRLSMPDAEWESRTKVLLTQGKETNQGAISELVKQRRGEQMLTYHELKFASASEIRIAQELERRGVLFFPLAVGVVSETGEGYKDRREVDFLVCQDGAFGVLEVSYHPNRYEQDSEKNAWIKRHGVLCVEHYSAERCYNQSSDVVSEFLAVLARHKR